MDELIVRAITAFYRTRGPGDGRQPDATSTRLTHQGKGYVVLRAQGEAQALAIYRCMNRGELKRLKRWPAGLIGSSLPADSLPGPTATPVLLDLVPVPRKIGAAAKTAADPEQAGLF